MGKKRQTGPFRVEVPGGGERVLLHACCAPCSSAIVECLLNQGIRPVIFYSNANIFPKAEYDIRLNECIRFARSQGLEIVEDTYDHADWRRCADGLEHVEGVGHLGLIEHAGVHVVVVVQLPVRKGGLQDRRNALLKEYGFYNQLFCGCEFSRRQNDTPLSEDL